MNHLMLVDVSVFLCLPLAMESRRVRYYSSDNSSIGSTVKRGVALLYPLSRSPLAHFGLELVWPEGLFLTSLPP